jgi:hypothetical protein
VRISTPARNRLLVSLPRRPIDVFKTSDKFVISFHIISFLHGREKCIAMPRKNLDPTASLDIVAVTGRGGFLSAASRRLLEIIRAEYGGKKSSGR